MVFSCAAMSVCWRCGEQDLIDKKRTPKNCKHLLKKTHTHIESNQDNSSFKDKKQRSRPMYDSALIKAEADRLQIRKKNIESGQDSTAVSKTGNTAPESMISGTYFLARSKQASGKCSTTHDLRRPTPYTSMACSGALLEVPHTALSGRFF